MDLSLPQLFGRVGSKTRLKDKIYKQMPSDFTTYVEPYVGGASVMLGYKFKPGQKVVINDLDGPLMRNYRIIKAGVPITPAILKKYNDTTTAQKNTLLNKTPTNNLQRLIHSLIKYNTTFGSTGKGASQESKNINLSTKLKKIPEYTQKLKGVTILNQNAIGVINKYNNKSTFLYLDPPYENSAGLYDNSSMNFEALAAALKKFKGRFLMSINDSKNIRNVFKDFKFRSTSDGGKGNAGIGNNTRKELFIRNY